MYLQCASNSKNNLSILSELKVLKFADKIHESENDFIFEVNKKNKFSQLLSKEEKLLHEMIEDYEVHNNIYVSNNCNSFKRNFSTKVGTSFSEVLRSSLNNSRTSYK